MNKYRFKIGSFYILEISNSIDKKVFQYKFNSIANKSINPKDYSLEDKQSQIVAVLIFLCMNTDGFIDPREIERFLLQNSIDKDYYPKERNEKTGSFEYTYPAERESYRKLIKRVSDRKLWKGIFIFETINRIQSIQLNKRMVSLEFCSDDENSNNRDIKAFQSNPSIVGSLRVSDDSLYFSKNESDVVNEGGHSENASVTSELVCFRTDIVQYEEPIFYELREDYIESIKKKVSHSNHHAIVINGKGGLGKTTTAIWLYNSLKSSYKRSAWISYNETIDESILSSVTFNSDIKRTKRERIECVKDFLFSNSYGKTLLIIDDANEQLFLNNDGIINLKELCQNDDIDVIVTTRTVKHITQSHDYCGYCDWNELNELSIEDSRKLFKYYYLFTELSYEDNKTIDDLINKVYRNSLLIEILAKAANHIQEEKDIGLEEFASIVFNDGKIDLNSPVNTNYSASTETEHILRNLYAISEMSYEEKEVIWSFAILPNIYLNKSIVNDVIRIDNAITIVEKLYDCGWLKYIPGTGYQMHDLIKTMLWNYREEPQRNSSLHSICIENNHNGFAPDYAFESLILSLQKPRTTFINQRDSYNDVEIKVQVLQSCEKHLLISDSNYYKLLIIIAHTLFYNLGYKYEAESYYKYSIKYIPNAFDCFDIANTCYEYAYLLSSMNNSRYIEAMDWLNVSLFYCYSVDLVNLISRGSDNNNDPSEEHNKYYLETDICNYLFNENKTEMITIAKECSSFMSDTVTDYVNEYPGLYLYKSARSILFRAEDYVEQFNSISEFELYARILDHFGYILTISTIRSDLAERLLRLSMRIRSYFVQMVTISSASEDEYESFMKPYMKHITLQKTEIDKILYMIGSHYSFFTHESQFELAKSIYNIIVDDTNNDNNGSIGAVATKKEIVSVLKIIASNTIRYNDINKKTYDSSILIQNLATTEDNLGYLLSHNKESYKEALKLLNEALDARRLLSDNKPEMHLSELSWTLTNLAELETTIDGKENLELAETHFLEAISIREELCNKTKGKYRDNKAWSCMGLARCYAKMGNNDQSNKYHMDAKDIFMELAKEDSAYKPDLDYVISQKDLKNSKAILGNHSHYSLP